MSIKLDRSEVDAFAEKLLRFSEKSAQEATAEGLTKTAKLAADLARQNVRKQFVLRNKWTLGSIKSTRSSPRRAIDKQFAIAGSKQPYLAKQELGGGLKRTKAGRRITTARGSREGATAYPRRKVARGKLAARNINTTRVRRVRGSRGRQAKIAVENARRKGVRFLFLRLGKDRSGIFEIQKREIRMVHRVMKRPLRVKPRPWLKPATDKARKLAPQIFKRQLEKRIAFDLR